ncbi:MAG: hypothetical protein IIW48_09645, partial [Clostridia bacterium]|nr:hypothetical protein [Clostridia bacterium]
ALVAVAALGSSLIISSLLSVIRNIKTRRLLETSIILRVVKWLFCFGFKVIKWVFSLMLKLIKWICKAVKLFFSALFRLLSKKTGVLLIAALLIYTAVTGFLCAGALFDSLWGVWLILCVLVFVGVCFIIALVSKDFDAIRKGAAQVRGGNVTHKISGIKFSNMRELSSDINDIAQGLDEAVGAKVTAERL